MENKQSNYLLCKHTDEWYTHPSDINLALSYIGASRFDLDPCAGVGTSIGVRNYDIGKLENGLYLDWDAPCIFVNPPYSDISPWVDKALSSVNFFKWCVMLLPVRTSVRWFHSLVSKLAFFDDGFPVFVDVPHGFVRFVFPQKRFSFGSGRDAPFDCFFVVIRGYLS